jgi:hypothetical protein
MRSEANWSWLAGLVREQRPGKTTRRQRRQAARLLEVRAVLAGWAARHSLPVDHVDQAAYFTIVSTRPDQRIDRVTALAETIFWIYVFDDFLDQRVESPRQIDLELGELLAPLRPYLGMRRLPDRPYLRRPPATSQANLLDELLARTMGAVQSPAGRSDSGSGELGLREALYSLLGQLEAVWRGLTGRSQEAAENQYRRRLVCRQLARTIASMRREYAWNRELGSAADPDRRLPARSAYLQNGAISIGMYAVAAVAASYEHERALGHRWQEGLAAIDAAGRIVRLANDLDTYHRETGEGKLSSVTLMLQALGSPILGLDPETSVEVERAKQVVGASLSQLIDYFEMTVRRLEEGAWLAFYLEHVVAFALVAYGRLKI